MAASLVLVRLVWGLLTHTYHGWPAALILLSGLTILGMGAVLLPAAIVFGMSLVFLVKKWPCVSLRAVRPLLALVIAALIGAWLPHGVTHGYWRARRGSFERVIQAIGTGRLVPNDDGLLALPKEYGFPAAGAGQVVVSGQGENLTVLFLTSRGAVGGWVGYMHVSTDAYRPHAAELAVERIADHWYWVESN